MPAASPTRMTPGAAVGIPVGVSVPVARVVVSRVQADVRADVQTNVQTGMDTAVTQPDVEARRSMVEMRRVVVAGDEVQ